MPFHFNPADHPVDFGWPAYLTKDFDRTPDGCAKAASKISATRNTKKAATAIGNRRSKKMDTFFRYIVKESIENFKDMALIKEKPR